jgi:penicillin-binding protein 1A
MALPIWALLYQKMYADKTLNLSDKAFRKPANVSIELNCEEEDDKKPNDDKKPDDDNDFNS